jgi:D-alanyl-D-alanine carboxypeptidase/D-alanyl-D-alanine-endopeptidase (penicillin-binding protein 4)
VLPYKVDAKPGDALAPLRDLAKKIADAGIKTINGDVTGIATRYPGQLYPDGWTIDDSVYDYGAPVSALTFNDNAVSLKLMPGEIGEPAELELTPANNPLLVMNEVTTESGGETHVQVFRTPGSNEIVLSGSIGKNAQVYEQDLAVLDPARWTASALIDALREQGITVRGEARSVYETLSPSNAANTPSKPANPSGVLLAAHQSVPLSEDIQVTNKVSQNLHAEMLLREVGYVLGGKGTLRVALEERAKFLQELGISADSTGIALQDGSGLARQDLTTPNSTVTLLRAMWERPERELWIASLPIGGVDGSLEKRFQGIVGARRIHAKTGSLSHVNALSGYIETKQHGWLAFSIMVNGTVGHDPEVRTFIDRLCGLLLGI